MKRVIIPHSQIEERLSEVIRLKNESWPYGLQSQLDWLKSNLNSCDLHFLMEEEAGLMAYANLVQREILINKNTALPVWAIGNVCVADKCKGKGKGAELMKHINEYLMSEEIPGILLCRGTLVEFYEKQGWTVVSNEQLSFDFDADSNMKVLVFGFEYQDKGQLHITGKAF